MTVKSKQSKNWLPLCFSKKKMFNAKIKQKTSIAKNSINQHFQLNESQKAKATNKNKNKRFE